MNILVATISVLPKTASNYNYKIMLDGNEKGEISAMHTNESVVKAFAELGIKIDKIIALCSDKSLDERNVVFNQKTAFEYYKHCAQDLYSNISIVDVKIENRKSFEILNEICNNITANDTVYLDIAGGQRTIANIIQLLAKVLQYKGIKNPLSLYADFQNADKFIVDTHEFTVMTDIADAINEFVTTGKSIQLNNCLKKIPEFSDLLSAMNDFSEKIMLCDIGNLDGTLSALKISIEKLSTNNSPSTIEQTVVNQMLPIIREKLFVGQDSIDYKQIIRWCLANGLIQQAVTIYIEKMPVYYFQTGILKGYVDLDKVEPKQGNSKETAGFYEYLFDKFAGTSTDELTSEFQIFIKEIFVSEDELPHKWVSKSSGNIREACIRLANFINKNYKCLSYKKDQLYNTTAPKELSSFLKQLQSNSEYHHFFVYNDINKWENRSSQGKKDTYKKKVKALRKIENDNLLLYKLMSHYLALKIMRNRMNHASETIYTEDEKKTVNYLQSIGFNIDFSISAITKIIERGLDIV